MTRIRVDFNRMTKDGLVIGSMRRADSILGVGDKVEAVQPEDDMSFDAVVRNVDNAGRVFLAVAWEKVSKAADFAAASPLVKPISEWFSMRTTVASGFTASRIQSQLSHQGGPAALRVSELMNA